MKKIYFIISCILLAVFVLTACTKKDVTEYHYTYTGENDLWTAEYKVDCNVTFTKKDNITISTETVSKEELVVTYQGELADLSAVRHVEISYKDSTGGGNLVEDLDPGESISSKVFKLSGGGTNTALPQKDDVVNITIQIDDQTQFLELVYHK